MKSSQGRFSGTSSFNYGNISAANVMWLMFVSFVGYTFFPREREQIQDVTDALKSIVNGDVFERVYNNNGIWTGSIKLGDNIKKVYEKWSGKNTEITDYLDYWINYFKNYETITPKESEEHMNSQEAATQ